MRMPMIVMTTRSSTRVKAARWPDLARSIWLAIMFNSAGTLSGSEFRPGVPIARWVVGPDM